MTTATVLPAVFSVPKAQTGKATRLPATLTSRFGRPPGSVMSNETAKLIDCAWKTARPKATSMVVNSAELSTMRETRCARRSTRTGS